MHYPVAVPERWADVPIPMAFLTDLTKEFRPVGTTGTAAAGFGVLKLSTSTPKAVSVSPRHARHGLGRPFARWA